MKRIAVLMLIHRDDEQTFRLIRHLSTDFDVFVHVDRKSSVTEQDLNIPNVYSFKTFSVYWGGYSQILAVNYLLKKAYEIGYDRYLLISGQDLPIRSNREIIDFFNNNTVEYISIEEKVVAGSRQKGGLDRVKKYWPNWFHRGGSSFSKYLFALQYGAFTVLSAMRSRPLTYEFYKGANWMNITHHCLDKILKYLDDNPAYIKRFRWTNCADEFFYQTIVMQLEGLEIENNCLRYIDWNEIEYPKVLRAEDYEKIVASNHLFARKFDRKRDSSIVERIYTHIATPSA